MGYCQQPHMHAELSIHACMAIDAQEHTCAGACMHACIGRATASTLPCGVSCRSKVCRAQKGTHMSAGPTADVQGQQRVQATSAGTRTVWSLMFWWKGGSHQMLHCMTKLCCETHVRAMHAAFPKRDAQGSLTGTARWCPAARCHACGLRLQAQTHYR
jgi:hypothetical protein